MTRRGIKVSLLLAAAAWSGLAPGAAGSQSARGRRGRGPTPEQKAALQLLTNAMDAMGGAAQLDSLYSVEIHSKGTRRLPNGADVAATTVTRIVFPERYRQDVTLPMGVLTTVVNGPDAFMIVDQTVLPLPKEERDAQSQAIYRSLLGLLRSRFDPDNFPTPAGRKLLEGKSMSLVRLGADAGAPTLAIDRVSGLVREVSYVMQSGGRSGRFVVTYSDYNGADGLKYPSVSKGTFDGTPVFSSTVERVQFNLRLQEALFQPPVARSPAPSPSSTPSAAPSPVVTPQPR